MPAIRRFTTAEAPSAVLKAVRQLLIEAFGGRFSEQDWEHTLGGWHVILIEGHDVLSHAAVVPRVLEVADARLHAGYVEGVATAPERQGEGLGQVAMADTSALIRTMFEIGALSTSRHGFYQRLGWEPWRGPTVIRHGSVPIRAQGPEGGVMVLRFGPNKDIDLYATLSFQQRRPDA